MVFFGVCAFCCWQHTKTLLLSCFCFLLLLIVASNASRHWGLSIMPADCSFFKRAFQHIKCLIRCINHGSFHLDASLNEIYHPKHFTKVFIPTRALGGTGMEKGTTTSTQSTHPVFLTPLCQVMRRVALAVEAAVRTTSVPLSLISSWLKHRLLTQTGGRWRLRPHNPARHCRHCSSPSSSLYCRDNGDNLEAGQRNCVLATGTANFLLFLHSWTMDHATNTCSFLCEESSTATCFPFCFPKEHQVPDWTASCFLQMSLKTISTLERILSQIFITGDFLSFISFYAAEVKRSYSEFFFSLMKKKKRGGGEETNEAVFFLSWA